MKALIEKYIVKGKQNINKIKFEQDKKKKKNSTKTRESDPRAVGNEIFPQHIMLKGTYFICNLYLYFLMWKKTSKQHIMLKGTYFFVTSI